MTNLTVRTWITDDEMRSVCRRFDTERFMRRALLSARDLYQTLDGFREKLFVTTRDWKRLLSTYQHFTDYFLNRLIKMEGRYDTHKMHILWKLITETVLRINMMLEVMRKRLVFDKNGVVIDDGEVVYTYWKNAWDWTA